MSSTEVFYSSSGDVREELNAGAMAGDRGYLDESQIKGVIIQRARRRATRVINGKLEPVYPTKIPFASGDVPKLIDSIAGDLSVYYVKRAKHPGPEPMVSNVKEEYFERSMELLQEIADRKIELPELTSEISYPETYHNRKDITPVFDMDDIESQVVDSDLKEDISEDRD